MRNKERKKIAEQIVKAERIIQKSEDPVAVKKAQQEITEISSCILTLEDLLAIDEIVQKILTF